MNPTTYHNGDAATFTGETKIIHGGLFHAARLTEGRRTGEIIWMARGPDGFDPFAERAKRDFQESQAGARRLRELEKL